MDAIVFPDIEDIVRGYIADELPHYDSTATAHVTIPNPRPEKFVTVRRTGGPKRDIVTDFPSLTFECWAATGDDALVLANLVRAIVARMAGVVVSGATVYMVNEFAGPALLPDPVSDQPRYTFTAGIAVRGSVRNRKD